MARNRVEGLDQRVRRLRAAIKGLEEEHAAARERVHTIEVMLDDSSSQDSESPPSALSDSASPVPERSEASDEEVAAAVRAVEDDRDAGFHTDRLVH